VPYEQLRKSFRYQHKYIEKELSAIHDKIDGCIKDTSLSAEKASQTIDDLIKQVEKLTRKVSFYSVDNVCITVCSSWKRQSKKN
jgi:macrophage erythroblast attacher